MMNGYSYGFLRRPSKQMVRIIFSIPYRLFIEPEKMERVIRIIFSTMERNDNSGKSKDMIEMNVSSIKTDLWITSGSILDSNCMPQMIFSQFFKKVLENWRLLPGRLLRDRSFWDFW